MRSTNLTQPRPCSMRFRLCSEIAYQAQWRTRIVEWSRHLRCGVWISVAAAFDNEHIAGRRAQADGPSSLIRLGCVPLLGSLHRRKLQDHQALGWPCSFQHVFCAISHKVLAAVCRDRSGDLGHVRRVSIRVIDSNLSNNVSFQKILLGRDVRSACALDQSNIRGRMLTRRCLLQSRQGICRVEIFRVLPNRRHNRI